MRWKMMRWKRIDGKTIVSVAVFALFGATGIWSFIGNVVYGKAMVVTAWTFSRELLVILPLTFVLTGLFEVWVKREHVERHLGEGAGLRGYFWAILLGGTVVGPMLVALPVAAVLQRKGASLTVCFIYIGSAAVCRIPMTVFEATLLGVPFTVIRYLTAIPIIVVSSILLGKVLTARRYQIKEVSPGK